MNHIENETFLLGFNERGVMDELLLRDDPFRMNWVITDEYLNQHGFEDQDKLFGRFILRTNNSSYNSVDIEPVINLIDRKKIDIVYPFDSLSVSYTYDLTKVDEMAWTIKLSNHNSNEPVSIDSFQIWASIAYIMFRDKNVMKNINESCAVFPHLSNDYSKIACVRRSNNGPHLGIYRSRGPLVSIGSFCRYQNLFFEQVSPSLDGCIFHSLELMTSSERDQTTKNDWIYNCMSDKKKVLAPNETMIWEFTFKPFETKQHFYETSLQLGHPVMDYTPVITKNHRLNCDVQIPAGCKVRKIWIKEYDGGEIKQTDITSQVELGDVFSISYQFVVPGEKKLVLQLEDGTMDFIVFNVLEPIKDIIEERIRYLFENSFISDPQDENYAAFKPISNQGESLGKLSLILMKNLIGEKSQFEIEKVEASAVFYVKNKWFVDGNFTAPRKLYGGFYRIFDFDYIAHIYFLLSKFKDEDLKYYSSETYLKWATEIMIMRFDESMHEDDREKNETKLCGVFSPYIKDLLQETKARGIDNADKLHELWNSFGEQLKAKGSNLAGAITEHYYDNAGFGPSCEALALFGYQEEAAKYGELLLANIGFSNDYRAQNPDRWWEALSYMVHSLWGGLVSCSTLVAYEQLGNRDYLQAAYRSMMPIFSVMTGMYYPQTKSCKKEKQPLPFVLPTLTIIFWSYHETASDNQFSSI